MELRFWRQHIGITQVAVAFCALGLTSCSSTQSAQETAAISQSLRPLAEQMCQQQRGESSLLPPREFTTDGCSIWPDASWVSCCHVHDIAYWCGGSAEQRKAADQLLRQCVADSGSPITGALMGVGVRAGGLWILPLPWRWGYGWPWLSPMENPTEEEP